MPSMFMFQIDCFLRWTQLSLRDHLVDLLAYFLRNRESEFLPKFIPVWFILLML